MGREATPVLKSESRQARGTKGTDHDKGTLTPVGTDRRHRKAAKPTREQSEERFSTDGKPFDAALAAVLAAGRGDDHKADERGNDE